MTFGQVAVMAEGRQREAWNPFAWIVHRIIGGELFNPFERRKSGVKRAALSSTESVSFIAGMRGFNVPPKSERLNG